MPEQNLRQADVMNFVKRKNTKLMPTACHNRQRAITRQKNLISKNLTPCYLHGLPPPPTRTPRPCRPNDGAKSNLFNQTTISF